MKSLDQELSQGSFLILPITIIIGLIVYNYKRVRTSILSVYCCEWLSCFITARKRSSQHASQVTWPGVSASGGLHPGGESGSREGSASGGSPSGGCADRPPPMINYGIWSTSGRYASYWNSFLLTLIPFANEVAGRRCFQHYLSFYS